MTPALHKKGISGPSPRSGRLTIAQQFSAGRWTVTAPSPCNGRLLLSFGSSSAFSRPFHGLRSASANPSTQVLGYCQSSARADSSNYFVRFPLTLSPLRPLSGGANPTRSRSDSLPAPQRTTQRSERTQLDPTSGKTRPGQRRTRPHIVPSLNERSFSDR